MSRPCTACAHPDRAEIDLELAAGRSYRRVLEHYSQPPLSLGALARHKEHLPAQLAANATAHRAAAADSVLAQLGELVVTARAVLDQATAAGRDGIALAALREVRATLLALAQIAAQIEARERRDDAAEEAEVRLLAEGLRAVLPAYPAAALALARWLAAAAGGADLASAVETLIPTTGVAWLPDSTGK